MFIIYGLHFVCFKKSCGKLKVVIMSIFLKHGFVLSVGICNKCYTEILAYSITRKRLSPLQSWLRNYPNIYIYILFVSCLYACEQNITEFPMKQIFVKHSMSVKSDNTPMSYSSFSLNVC